MNHKYNNDLFPSQFLSCSNKVESPRMSEAKKGDASAQTVNDEQESLDSEKF
jgi:hypothetical protein